MCASMVTGQTTRLDSLDPRAVAYLYFEVHYGSIKSDMKLPSIYVGNLMTPKKGLNIEHALSHCRAPEHMPKSV